MTSHMLSVSKKPREPFKAWVPTEKDTIALEGAVPIPCQGTSGILYYLLHLLTTHLLGRRGLLNLGQTCFLNVVLQCFIHNPLLRNYFLSDKHNWKQCKIENCTCCEMDKLFSEVGTTALLRTWYLIYLPLRSTQKIQILTAQSPFWLLHGAPPQSCLVMHSRTHTSSSSQLWTKFTQLPGVPQTFPVFASSITLSQANCKAMLDASVVGM